MTKTGNHKQVNPMQPRAKLGLPDLDHSRSAVLESLRSPESKRGYQWLSMSTFYVQLA
jgi:hypothetical protein